MTKLFQITLLGLLTFSISTFAQISSSKWQAQPIVIDGDGSDWGTLPRFFNAESNIKYEFRNDTQNLYIILKAADRATQMQLMQAGFSVKLKVKTSPPIKVGIKFPSSRMQPMPSMNQDGRTDKLVDKSVTTPEFMPKDTAVTEGFLFCSRLITSKDKDEKRICFARSKSNREQATYEIRIPLREVFGSDYLLDNISSTPIQLQVNINELSQNNISKMRGGMGGGRHGGEGRSMGGMRGGGEMSGGEMSGGNMGEMEAEMQSTMRSGFSLERKSFSIDFKLSTGK
jgi:hypothetical protein